MTSAAIDTMTKRKACGLWLVTLATLMAGCRSAGIAQRRTERIEAYRLLDPQAQSLVDKGQIQDGMDTNAVFVAWGPPTDAFALDAAGGQRLIWNYEKDWSYKRSRLAERGSSRGRPTYVVERQHIRTTYAARSVVFVNGKVVQWQKHKPPILDQPLERSRYS